MYLHPVDRQMLTILQQECDSNITQLVHHVKSLVNTFVAMDFEMWLLRGIEMFVL